MKKLSTLCVLASLCSALAAADDDGIKRYDTADGYAYEFGLDGLQGDTLSSEDVVKARLAKTDACSEQLKKSLSAPQLDMQRFANALFEQARCYDSCRTRKDFDFRHRCVNWTQSVDEFNQGTSTGELAVHANCIEKSDYQGFVDGLYEGWFKDSEGNCKPRYVRERVALAPPADFYIVLDNSGSMSAVYAEILDTVLPELIRKIQGASADSRILLSTHNMSRGDRWYLIDGRDPNATQYVDDFKRRYGSADGTGAEAPLDALVTYAQKAGSLRKDVKNVVIVISDEADGPDYKGTAAADLIQQTFGKQLVFVTTLPPGAHTGADETLARLGTEGRRTSNATAVQEILKLMDDHFRIEDLAGNTSIPQPREYQDVISVTKDKRVLSSEEYIAMDGRIYFRESVNLKPYDVIDATFEYNPPPPDMTLVRSKAVAWFINTWVNKLGEIGDKAVQIKLADLTGVVVINKYLQGMGKERLRAAYSLLIMSLDFDTLDILFRSTEGSDDTLNSLDAVLSNEKTPEAKAMRKYVSTIRAMILNRRTHEPAVGCKAIPTIKGTTAIASNSATPAQTAFLSRLAALYSEIHGQYNLFCQINGKK